MVRIDVRVVKAEDERRVGVHRTKRSTAVDLDMETNLPFTLAVLQKVYVKTRERKVELKTWMHLHPGKNTN